VTLENKKNSEVIIFTDTMPFFEHITQCSRRFFDIHVLKTLSELLQSFSLYCNSSNRVRSARGNVMYV
jgi:hypothetical protein